MPDHDAITVSANQMGGVPCIRRLRIPVATIVGLVAQGKTVEEICADYPDLVPADIRHALAYAAVHDLDHRGDTLAM